MVHDGLRIIIEQKIIHSVYLKRDVVVDFYVPANFAPSAVSLLLINDGQTTVTVSAGDVTHLRPVGD